MSASWLEICAETIQTSSPKCAHVIFTRENGREIEAHNRNIGDNSVQGRNRPRGAKWCFIVDCHSSLRVEEIMGARGRHWELLIQKFGLSSCAGAVDNRRIQVAARERQEEGLSTDKKVRIAETWAEHELIEKEGPGESEADLLLEIPDKVNLGGAVSKEELGRATWTFLHTVAAQFPQKPTKQQQRDAKELMAILTRLYPCKTCAEHFKEVLKKHPPKTDSGIRLAEWMCQVHNVVNKSLGKPEFPCQQVDIRWGAFDCDGACALHARPPHK